MKKPILGIGVAIIIFSFLLLSALTFAADNGKVTTRDFDGIGLEEKNDDH